METVLKSPRPPKRRTCTPTDSANASPSVSTPLGAELVSITVANAVGSPRACGSRSRGAVTTTSPRCWSAARARESPHTTRSSAVVRGRVFQPLPRGRLFAGSGGRVFWLGDHPPPVPSHPSTDRRGSGSDRARPPSQLRGSGGFAPPSLTRLRLRRRLARSRGRGQVSSRTAPLGRFRLALDVPARRFEPAEEERERFLRREHAVDRAGCRCTDRGGRADAARGHGALATREGRPGGHRPVLHSRAPPPLASDDASAGVRQRPDEE